MFVCTGTGGDLVGKEKEGPVNKSLSLLLANASANSHMFQQMPLSEGQRVLFDFVSLSVLKKQLIMPLM